MRFCPGDGIGIEVMDACLAVLDACRARSADFRCALDKVPGGALHYRDTGDAFPETSFERSARADAILFGAMGWPEIRYPDGTEIAPQLDLRERLGLYRGRTADPRLARRARGARRSRAPPTSISSSSANRPRACSPRAAKGVVEGDELARDTMVITRKTTERLFDFSFRLAERRRRQRGRPGLVTCVDKSNVFRSFAFFRRIFDERARRFPTCRRATHYIDAMALDLVRRPWDFDVIVTENLFGDILSDLGAGLIGGMGFAPSADIGDDARPLPAVPRHRARHRRAGHGQSDRDAALRGDDARLARRPAQDRQCASRGRDAGERRGRKLRQRRDPAL